MSPNSVRERALTSIFAIATLIPWNSIVTVDDFWQAVYHDEQILNIFTLLFQVTLLLVNLFGVFLLSDFTFWKRLVFGNTVSALVLVVLLFSRSLPVAYVMMLIFGFADGLLEATLYGYATTVKTTQYAQGGQSASGAIVSIIRIITKLVLTDDHQSGTEWSAYLFFGISALLCIVAAVASLSVRSVEATRQRKLGRNKNLILGIVRYCWPDMLIIFLNYVLSLSIFPTFFVTVRSSHELGLPLDWLMVLLIATFNILDFIGKQFLGSVAVRERLRFVKVRRGLLLLVLSRLALCAVIVVCNRGMIPSASVLFVCAGLFGLSNGCASVNGFVNAANNARDWYTRRHLSWQDEVALQSMQDNDDDELDQVSASETDDYKEMEETIGYLMIASLCVGLAVGLSIGFGLLKLLLLFSS